MGFDKMRLFALALGVVVVAGCDSKGMDGASCITDSHCAKEYLCHPLAKLCVKRCDSASKCPDSAKSCAALTTRDYTDGGTITTANFCQCLSTEKCGGNKDNGIVCGEEEKFCLQKCTSDVDCTFGRRCDVSSGQCRGS